MNIQSIIKASTVTKRRGPKQKRSATQLAFNCPDKQLRDEFLQATKKMRINRSAFFRQCMQELVSASKQ